MASPTSGLQFVCHNCIRRGLHQPVSSHNVPFHSQTRAYRVRGPPRVVNSASRSRTHLPEPGIPSSVPTSRLEKFEDLPRRMKVGRLQAPRNDGSNKLSTTHITPRITKHPPTKIQPTPEARFHVEQALSTHRLNLRQSQDFNWYWETVPPNISQKNQARLFFTKGHKAGRRAQFLRSVALFRQFPAGDVPEVAFVGRSNVGKSSLLNAIVNAGDKEILAKTSATPGCTRTMNLYGVGGIDGVRIKPGQSGGHDKIVGIGGLLIVDLPGYGEGSLNEWGVEIMKYLTKRRQLRRVFVLIDAMHGVKEKDRSLLATLRQAGVPHQVILSKLDRIYIPEAKTLERLSKGINSKNIRPRGSISELNDTMGTVRSEIQPPMGAGALGELLGVSSELLVNGSRLGIDSVRFAVLQAAGFNFENKTPRQAHEVAETPAKVKGYHRRL